MCTAQKAHAFHNASTLNCQPVLDNVPGSYPRFTFLSLPLTSSRVTSRTEEHASREEREKKKSIDTFVRGTERKREKTPSKNYINFPMIEPTRRVFLWSDKEQIHPANFSANLSSHVDPRGSLFISRLSRSCDRS